MIDRVKLFSMPQAIAADLKVPLPDCPELELHGPAAKVRCAMICSGRLPIFPSDTNKSECRQFDSLKRTLCL